MSNSVRFGNRFTRRSTDRVTKLVAANDAERRASRRRFLDGKFGDPFRSAHQPPPVLTGATARRLGYEPAHSRDFLSRQRFADASAALTPRGVSVEQEAFDRLLKRAVIDFSPNEQDAFEDHELFALLRRADPDFAPQQYAGTFGQLLRLCKYLDSRKGKLWVQREFDMAVTTRDVTVDLAPYEFGGPGGSRRPRDTISTAPGFRRDKWS